MLLLLALPTLFFACSSSDINDDEGGVTPPATEQTVSEGTVDLTNGVSISVGALNTTRAGSGPVNFVIDLNKLGSQAEDVLKGFGDYKLKADDFAVRRDGVYDGEITPTDNKYQYWTIEMVEENLKVAVKNLEKLTFADCNDYTFEFYLWIENKELKNDGSGSYDEKFTDTDKANWIGATSWPVADGVETGMDLSEAIWTATGSNGANFFEGDGGTDCGLLVRYNVYRGLQGYDGNTPYIKVSVHVEKKDQTTANSEKNECTWVHIPYKAK